MLSRILGTSSDNPRVWRALVHVWSFVLFAAIGADFATNNGLYSVLSILAAIYITCLAIYSAEKEFERWHEYYDGRHPGEVYVFIWTILILFLVGVQIFTNKPYSIPEHIVSTYIAVLGILAITGKSKSLHAEHHEKKELE